jgi:hypothetical protein
LDASGIARRDPVNRADCFTNSLREGEVDFIIIDLEVFAADSQIQLLKCGEYGSLLKLLFL